VPLVHRRELLPRTRGKDLPSPSGALGVPSRALGVPSGALGSIGGPRRSVQARSILDRHIVPHNRCRHRLSPLQAGIPRAALTTLGGADSCSATLARAAPRDLEHGMVTARERPEREQALAHKVACLGECRDPQPCGDEVACWQQAWKHPPATNWARQGDKERDPAPLGRAVLHRPGCNAASTDELSLDSRHPAGQMRDEHHRGRKHRTLDLTELESLEGAGRRAACGHHEADTGP